jgi:peptidoglycan/xylan/chitin deacetylase (PgdA/CDA1 family)
MQQAAVSALHHRVLAAAYPVVKAAKAIGRPFGLARRHPLRVLIYHDVAPEDEARFAAQLRWLARSWRFVSVEQFAALVSGEEPVQGRNLLLTFDDGFASQRRVAEQVLNPMGIQALFFAVSDFVCITDRSEARDFISRNIYPHLRTVDLPVHWYNMGWSDLEALLEQGHSVGGHTLTHAKLSTIAAEADLAREIVDSANTLARRLGTPVEHFAYTFGDIGSFSARALAVARRRFRFIYSGLRGDNAGAPSWTLRRDAASAKDPLWLLGAYVEGAADFHYARSRDQLASWA